MSKVATVFTIFPPNELNAELVSKKEIFENHLATEFPGYKFDLVDLRLLRPVGPGGRVMFGDGTKFVVLPLLGETGGRLLELPGPELIREISSACQKFDLENVRRYVA